MTIRKNFHKGEKERKELLVPEKELIFKWTDFPYKRKAAYGDRIRMLNSCTYIV
jgi:hypothetical protein